MNHNGSVVLCSPLAEILSSLFLGVIVHGLIVSMLLVFELTSGVCPSFRSMSLELSRSIVAAETCSVLNSGPGGPQSTLARLMVELICLVSLQRNSRFCMRQRKLKGYRLWERE